VDLIYDGELAFNLDNIASRSLFFKEELKISALIPIFLAESTWFCIKAINGDTTKVIPGIRTKLTNKLHHNWNKSRRAGS
jgi:hypothetical protein